MRGQQSASAAAATVILTGLLIILYILFLPPAEREALIGSSTADTNDSTIVDEFDVLLDESPRVVSPQPDRSETRALNPVTLLARGEYVPVFSSGETRVYSSRYDKQTYERTFTLDALPENPQMEILFDDVSGPVIVRINGQTVYQNEPESSSMKGFYDDDVPLRRGTNTIEIESGETWWFWGENFAQIRSIGLIADVYNPELAYAEQRFSIPDQNRRYLERAYLRFFLSCDGLRQSLNIELNGYPVERGLYDCESAQQIDFAISDLEDTNELSFETDTGVAVIEAPTIRFLYDEAVNPLYYFEISEDQWEDLENDDKDAILRMRFVRDDNEKDLIADLNGNFVTVRLEDEYVFREDVTRSVVEGENYLELEPRKTANIVELELFLVAAD